MFSLSYHSPNPIKKQEIVADLYRPQSLAKNPLIKSFQGDSPYLITSLDDHCPVVSLLPFAELNPEGQVLGGHLKIDGINLGLIEKHAPLLHQTPGITL